MQNYDDFTTLNLPIFNTCLHQASQHILRDILNLFVVRNEDFIIDVELLDEVDAQTRNFKVDHKFSDFTAKSENNLFAVGVIFDDGYQQPDTHQDYRYLFAFNRQWVDLRQLFDDSDMQTKFNSQILIVLAD